MTPQACPDGAVGRPGRSSDDPVYRVADLVAELATARRAADAADAPDDTGPLAIPSPERRLAGDDGAGEGDGDGEDDAVEPEPRPRIVDDPAILGLSRHSRGRVGSRLFTLFFVFVFAVIVIQLVVALLQQA